MKAAADSKKTAAPAANCMAIEMTSPKENVMQIA